MLHTFSPAEQNTLPAYTWSQTDDDITVQFTLKKPAHKDDVTFTLTSHEIKLSVNEEGELLSGELNAAVDVEGSTWTLSDQTK